MVPPATMLATKNRGGSCSLLCLALALVVAGCTPAGPRALLDGRRLLEDGRYEPAVEKFKIATSLLHTNAQAWNYLGLAYHHAGQPTNAAAAYQKALDLNRELLEARYNLGCLWLEQNKPELARAEFTSYTLRRGNAVEGWLKLGVAQLRARDLSAAEKSFREALRITPGNSEALNGLGLVQLHRTRPREAVQCFNAALEQQPDYRPALLNLASVSLQHLNDRAGALQKYREYLALKPRHPNWEAVNALAKFLEQPWSAPSRPPTNPVVVAPTVAATNVTKAATAAVVHVPPPKTEAAPPKADVPSKKVEAPQPQAKTGPQPPVARSAPPPAQTAAVEVVILPPEPLIKTAPEILPSDTIVTRATPIADPPPVVSATVVPKESATPEKQGSRLNPAATNLSEAASTGGITPPLPTVSSNQRYVYLSPVKPPAGNRGEAERAFAQGQQAQRANRMAEATQAYRQATQADPSYFEAHYNLGLVAFNARSYRQSLAAWENALAIQPESVDARYNFALALKAANHATDAANELRQILAANANETRAHLVLGNLWAEQWDDAVQARAHYLKVLELDPRHPQASAIRFWLVAHPP